MAKITFPARGDSGSANNSDVNVQNTNTTPLTSLTFTSGTDGDIRLDFNGGLPDPDTQVIIDGIPYEFTVIFEAFTPTSGQNAAKLSNLAGQDLRGERAVETLRAGDMVLNADGEPRRILWVGHRRLDTDELARHPHLRPVCIPEGCFGPGMPHSPLSISPQHRIFLTGWAVELATGMDAALIPALHLVGDRVVRGPQDQAVDYFHLLFEDHEVVLSNGLPTESLQPTVRNVRDMAPDAVAELKELFPQGFRQAGPSRPEAARLPRR